MPDRDARPEDAPRSTGTGTGRSPARRRTATSLLWCAALGYIAVTAEQRWVVVLAVVLLLVQVALLAVGRMVPDTPRRRPVDPRYGEPGGARVELLAPGDRLIAVIKALREVRPLSLAEAKDLAGAAPTTVAADLSVDSARAVAERLEAQGATVRVVPPGVGS